ncbi:MAG: NosD domain-containing protein, partial [Fimbriimonadaceae bacterium]
GEYVLTTGITLKSNVRMIGDGMHASVFKIDNSYSLVGALFNAADKDNMEFEDLGFEGATLASNPAILLRFQSLNGDHGGIAIRRCRFYDFDKAGRVMVDLQGPDDVLFENCLFDKLYIGIRSSGANRIANRIVCIGCEFRRFTQNASAMNVVDFGTRGIQFYDCRYHTLHAEDVNSPNDSAFQPLQLTDSKTGDKFHDYASISACYIEGSGEVHDTNPPYTSRGTADQFAVYNMRASSVFANVSIKGGDNGIAPWYSRKSTIAGNYCDRNKNHGIVGQGVDRMTFFGNVSTDNGVGGNPNQGGIALVTQYGTSQLSCTANHIVGNVVSGVNQKGISLYLDPPSTGGVGVFDTSWGFCGFPIGSSLEAESALVSAGANTRITGTTPMDRQFVCVDLDVPLATAASNHEISSDSPPVPLVIPTGSAVRSVQAIVRKPTSSLGGTAPKFAIGTSADPKKYGLSSGKGWNTGINQRQNFVVPSGGDTLKLYAVDTNGIYTGSLTIGGSNNVVRVKIIYESPVADLPNYASP